MSLPLIGVTTYGRNSADQFHLYANYLEAVRVAGGVPILLTPGETHPEVFLARLDGLILTGGGDVSPDCCNGETHPTIYSNDLERDEFELKLAQLALNSTIPTLGICRGLQVLNLASGGDKLIPHVPEVFTEMKHRVEPPNRQTRAQPTTHWVTVAPQSHLAQIVECDRIPVVSWHHQAIQTVPPDWRLAAQAPDGLIEAIEYLPHPWLLADSLATGATAQTNSPLQAG
ncbi:MAG: gamma-glutamyl-gamma-aminobutyrate hydrolase family protein [Leptolyngbya sp. SIO1D8]|nr:gamma-glutamyl-gamma-aminobutyrate hydrolase family protein [Leptolyngbya sp. SIO1D8]